MKDKILLLLFSLLLTIKAQSNSQLKQVKGLIKSGVVTKSQVLEAAQAKGLKESEINNLIENESRINKNKDKIEQNIEPLENNNLDRVNNQKKSETKEREVSQYYDANELPIIEEKQELFLTKESNIEKKDTNLNLVENPIYFGYDIFKRDPALFQASSVGLVDPEYLIGPGDEIILMLWGETQFRQLIKVDREGFIFIPDIGQVFVNGLNLNLLESKLFRVLSQYYASLDPANNQATTFLDVSLGNLRPLRIQVMGEVGQPGAYTVSPTSTLFSSLYYFKGPTILGSLRDVRLIREGRQISSIDFYDYLLTGTQPNDQKLQLDDVVFIPKRKKTITILGEVNRPGIYELKDKESLSNLISMAGDLKVTAYLDRAQIDRIVPFNKRKEMGMDRKFVDVSLVEILESKKPFDLQDGDRIQIFPVMELRQNIVFINGAVSRPGSYDLGDGLNLSELIKKADGILGDAYLDRIDIVRTKADFTEKLLKLNLDLVLNGDQENDIILNSLDRITIYSMSQMIPKTFVSISGHVKAPGRYLLQENMTLYDLIFKSGGFIDEEFLKMTYLKRAELVRVKVDSDEKEIISFNLNSVLNRGDIASILLRPNDAVRIYSTDEIEGELRYVSISGHVKRPGRYELFEGNMTLYDLIFKAGGYEDIEYKKNAYIDRAELVRVLGINNEKEIITFNIDSVLSRNEIASLNLKVNDAVRIYSKDEIFGNLKFVSISGNVKNPGQYELYEKNMTLYDLIFRSGGFEDVNFKNSTYLDRADLIRTEKTSMQKFLISFNLESIINDKDSKQNIKLEPGDEIKIYPKNMFTRIGNVSIDGFIKNPGNYDLKIGMTLQDLIVEAGGLTSSNRNYFIEVASLNDTIINDSLMRIVKINSFKDFTIPKSKNITPEPKKILETSKYNLKPMDNISVRVGENQGISRVSISGEVRYPGIYSIVKSKETVGDIIKRAGGFTENAYPFSSSIIRNNKQINIDLQKVIFSKRKKFDLNLIDGDKIAIEKKPGIVEIVGSVNAPGLYKYTKGLRVKDLIKMAGGYNLDFEKDNIYIKYPNGISRKYGLLNNHKVFDGSILTVGAKEKVEPLNKTEYAKELTSIFSNLIQALSIILLATR